MSLRPMGTPWWLWVAVVALGAAAGFAGGPGGLAWVLAGFIVGCVFMGGGE